MFICLLLAVKHLNGPEIGPAFSSVLGISDPCFCLMKTWRLRHVYNHLCALWYCNSIEIYLKTVLIRAILAISQREIKYAMCNTLKKLCFSFWMVMRFATAPALLSFHTFQRGGSESSQLESTCLQVAGSCVVVVVVLPTSPPCLVVDTVVGVVVAGGQRRKSLRPPAKRPMRPEGPGKPRNLEAQYEPTATPKSKQSKRFGEFGANEMKFRVKRQKLNTKLPI